MAPWDQGPRGRGRGVLGKRKAPSVQQMPIRSAEEVLIERRRKCKEKDLRKFDETLAAGPIPFTKVLTEAEKLEAAR